ncbi:selenoprotein N-like [Oopsacas minuta]|uniref:Selenoprotein N-like n=1 Tax=Oopsacas minuta TaxID=111878 RepID=A0AAV7K145_9METZ|nr:selenoprotein N-like [Oopsacas minuta]
MSARKRTQSSEPDPGSDPPYTPPPKDTRDIEEERYQEWLANTRFVKNLLKAIFGMLFIFLLIFVVAILFGGAYYESNFSSKVTKGSPARWSLGLNQQVPSDVISLFEIYDSDASGAIEPWEFKYIAKLLNERKDDPFVFQEEIPEGEGITVYAEYSPIVNSSMKTFQDQQKSYFKGFMAEKTHFIGLFNWINAEYPNMLHSQKNFRSFLPAHASWEVGMSYRLISSIFGEDREEIYNSNRYNAPQPSGREIVFFKLLQQFHHNVFLQNRFGPRGGVAMIRAKAGPIIEVVFRIHAEYQLNEHPLHPFWFSPAHFTGNLVFNTDTDEVLQFELYLPSIRKLNVDMEWITGSDELEGEKMEVDIGYTSAMKLSTNQTFEIPAWDHEKTKEEATIELDRVLYPFKRIPYIDIRDAVDTARVENKLVHSIIMWEDLMANSSVKQEVKDLLKKTMDSYEFPVQSMVMRPDTGDIVHMINANKLMEFRDSEDAIRVNIDPLSYSYNEFLLEGMRKAREEQAPVIPE